MEKNRKEQTKTGKEC